MVQPYLALHCMVHRNDNDHVLPPATVTQFQDALDKLQPLHSSVTVLTSPFGRQRCVATVRERT